MSSLAVCGGHHGEEEFSTLHRVLARDPEPARGGIGRLTLTVIAVAAVALAVVVVPPLLTRPRPTRPSPRPGVATIPGSLQIVPDPGAPRREAVTTSVRAFLQTLYETAFVNGTRVSPSPSPSAAAEVPSMLTPLFTAAAVRALSAQPGVFDPGNGVNVSNGRLDFAGVISMTGPRPVQAFLEVGFTGSGASHGTPVTVTQRGTVLLVHSEQGWLVGGFDVKLEAVSVTPSPSASHGARS